MRDSILDNPLSHLFETNNLLQGMNLNANVVFMSFVLSTMFIAYLLSRLISSYNLTKKIKRVALDFINWAFGINPKMKKGLMDLKKQVHEAKFANIEPIYSSIPHLSDDEIIERLEKVKTLDKKGAEVGKQGGNYYFSTKEDIREFVSKHASDFFYTNIMHFDHCKGTQLIENELISFMLELVNAPKGAVGTTTTGGTESIIISMLTYRELGLSRGIKEPEVILSENAHVAFEKAAFLLNMKVRVIPVSHVTGEFSIDRLLKEINKNTVAVITTAVTYAHGVIDPIEEVSKALEGTEIMMHVDCCLGGFIVSASALKDDGRIPVVDFRNKRVGTISIDPHKYGESPKGCSLLLFRNDTLKKLSLYYNMHWNGGIYATSSIPGSRPSAAFVGAWISLVRQGKEGLLKNYDLITQTLDYVVEMLKDIPELRVIGNPKGCVVTFTTTKASKLSIFDIQSQIKEDGWDLSIMQRPFAIHITVTKNNAKNLRHNLEGSLRKAIDYVKKNPKATKESYYNVLYGSLVKLPDSSMIGNAIKTLIVEINRLKIED